LIGVLFNIRERADLQHFDSLGMMAALSDNRERNIRQLRWNLRELRHDDLPRAKLNLLVQKLIAAIPDHVLEMDARAFQFNHCQVRIENKDVVTGKTRIWCDPHRPYMDGTRYAVWTFCMSCRINERGYCVHLDVCKGVVRPKRDCRMQ